MTKRFRPWNPKQKWLLPPEITEFIPEGRPAHFVRDLVVVQLDGAVFEQCYNAQAGVDAKAQVIVACDMVNTNADCPQLLGMVDQVQANLGRKPRVCSADAGYCSEANLAGLESRKIRAYIATGRQKHGTKAATHAKNGKPGSLIKRETGTG